MDLCADIAAAEDEGGDLAALLLDASPLGIVLLDAAGWVVRRNATALRMAEAGDGLKITERGPRLIRQSDDRVLQRLITAALRERSGGAMPASRPSGRRPYAVQVMALPAMARPAVCIEIHDPETRPALSRATLQSVYGLSQSEAALAQSLAAGDDLKAAAEQLGIRYSTARTQLGAIFRKTETKRQGQLIRLLLGLQSAAGCR